MSVRAKLIVIGCTGVSCIAVMLLNGLGLYRVSMVVSGSVIMLALAVWRGLKSR